ncbi:uncharacterized membrane protein YhaH (DUF805 family) [Litorimonas taeanensis]|uniref:Uncharacterized membrane protein YhaH (DUF805 family) n=1 Tax=Litorimonas taeanensis TaxID=568099 RepID=A0A420WCQ6_9PROT|nr:DUF805 domain-containing protein [Litorimonas taeanensis]RKQ68814.1 uncharacterized membrane protein YhaH (DUF805 family) [Litorimonas taeanensis]
MNMYSALRSFIDQWANFQTRSRRSEFWWVQFAYIMVTAVAISLDYSVLGLSAEDGLTPFILLVEVVTLIPMAALMARRLHDVGLTGWAQLPLYLTYISYIPGYDDFIVSGLAKSGAELVLAVLYWAYFVWILYNLVKDGDRWANRYGANPKYKRG